ncbi:MAG: hypothetical protein ACREFX_13985 [Opitutaceae bacterium]
MRRIFAFARLVFGSLPALAAAASPAAPSVPPKTTALDLISDSAAASVLPLTLPGYELRVLDKRKLLYFDVAGSWVEIPLPILFYFPTSERSEALRLVRETADQLRSLGAQAQAAPTASALAAQLDRAADLLGP